MATTEQMALADKIADQIAPNGVQNWLSARAAALAAIVETSELAAKMADRNALWHAESFHKEIVLKNNDKQTHYAARCREAEEISTSLRTFVHLKGPDHA